MLRSLGNRTCKSIQRPRFSRFRCLSTPEGLEPRAVPGGSLLEILLGLPLIAPLFDSFSPVDASRNGDKLPARPLAGEDQLTEIRYDAMHPDAAAREMRSFLQIASVEKANTLPVIETGKDRAAEATDALLSTTTNLGAKGLSADPGWFDALLALAIHRPKSAAPAAGESSPSANAAGAAAPASPALPHQAVAVNDRAAMMPDAKGDVPTPPVRFGGGSPSHASSGSLKVDHGRASAIAGKGAPVRGAVPVKGGDGDGNLVALDEYEPYTQPTANDDDFYTYHDSTIAISAPGVLENDWFEYLTGVSLVSGPSHAASFSFDSDGSFSYTPAWHFVGTDTFVYQLTSGPYSDTATVFLGVANDAPIAEDDAGVYLTKHDTFISVEAPGVTSNDYDPNSDPFQAILVTPPAHAAPDGFHFNADGSFDYMPAYHFVGDDTFTYKLNDGLVDGNVATVTIGVFNIEPVAANDTYSVKHDALLQVSAPGVKTNDYDSDGDPITASLVSGPSHAASFTFNSDGSFNYTSTYHYLGNDSFTYKVNDGIADSYAATVTLEVFEETPYVEIVPIDTAASELSPNELIDEDYATFLITRSECRDHDIAVRLQFSGADREDYELRALGSVISDTVPMPAGYEYVEVTFIALHDDMTEPGGYEMALIEIAPATDGSYAVGASYSEVFTLADTSTWRNVQTNGQTKPFPPFTASHPDAPTSGSGYTVVIVGGGAEDSYFFGMLGGGSERGSWTSSAVSAFSGAYIYNDVPDATGFANVVGAFPAGSIDQLAIGGHGTYSTRVGIQPTNNNTVVPTGYDFIDSTTLGNLSGAQKNAMRAALAPGAQVQVFACGSDDPARDQAGQTLATDVFQRDVTFAHGSVIGWDTGTPGSEKENGYVIQGAWITKHP